MARLVNARDRKTFEREIKQLLRLRHAVLNDETIPQKASMRIAEISSALIEAIRAVM